MSAAGRREDQVPREKQRPEVPADGPRGSVFPVWGREPRQNEQEQLAPFFYLVLLSIVLCMKKTDRLTDRDSDPYEYADVACHWDAPKAETPDSDPFPSMQLTGGLG